MLLFLNDTKTYVSVILLRPEILPYMDQGQTSRSVANVCQHWLLHQRCLSLFQYIDHLDGHCHWPILLGVYPRMIIRNHICCDHLLIRLWFCLIQHQPTTSALACCFCTFSCLDFFFVADLNLYNCSTCNLAMAYPSAKPFEPIMPGSFTGRWLR